jgi:octaheme c-type cytochrome (tetrathionate reductase family)
MKHFSRTLRVLAIALVAGAFIAGCSGDDGKDGTPGTPGATGSTGATGATGPAGLNCWDLNGNGVGDLATEDINKDGKVDVYDCRTTSSGYDTASLHKGYFTENPYTSTSQCLYCHGKSGDQVMKSAHWKWEGTVSGIKGFEGTIHGKKDLLNNFCLAVPTNEGRCAQCHVGYGWGSKNFNFGDPKNIDCLACHDQTGTYKKVATPTAAQPVVGGPDMTPEALQKVAQSVGMNGGVPPRSTCVFCHARAGGDDNVKHGDISTRMGFAKATDPAADPAKFLNRTEDVHMGYDPVAKKGGDMKCVACHQVKKDTAGNMLDHGIGGFMYHSTDEGVMKDCTDCHSPSIHAGTPVERLLLSHDRLACQVCHIPAIARKVATYVDWRWSLAGATTPPVECPSEPKGVAANGTTLRATYSQLKGCFTWATNVRPELRYYNGKWNRIVMGVNDKGLDTSQPVDLGSPAATYRDADAKIYPFKKMTGNQPFDSVDKTVLVPHLWGTVTGANPYWSKFDWNLALVDASAYSASLTKYGAYQQYNGTYEFDDTFMLLKVDHEVAPKEQALGYGGACDDCHLSNQIDWAALGWTADPAGGGTQTLAD